MIEAIIFDCDGVIIDSEPLFEEAFYVQMKKYGIVPDVTRLKDSTGVTPVQFCLNVLEAFPEIDRSVDELMEDYDESIDEMLMADDLKPMEGFCDFVRDCHGKGIVLAVASSSPLEYVRHKLRIFGVEDLFSLIVSGDDVTRSKPDPEIFDIAAARLDILKEKLLVIEDSVNGIKAARAAGIKVVGFKGSVIKQDTSQADQEVYAFKDIKL